jgi:hypothetical protein
MVKIDVKVIRHKYLGMEEVYILYSLPFFLVVASSFIFELASDN